MASAAVDLSPPPQLLRPSPHLRLAPWSHGVLAANLMLLQVTCTFAPGNERKGHGGGDCRWSIVGDEP